MLPETGLNRLKNFNAILIPYACIPKAAGLGITLTAADYIFLMDPWWNPAVEEQAIDRAHRIGRQSLLLSIA